MSLDRTLGARVARLRHDARLTQDELAERCQVSGQTIGRLERGAQLPSVATLDVIATALGVELGDLLRRSPAVDPTPLDLVIDRLAALLRRRGIEDAELVLEIAEQVFRRYSPG